MLQVLRCSATSDACGKPRVGLRCEQKLFWGQKYTIKTQEHELLAEEPALFVQSSQKAVNFMLPY